MGTVFVVGVVRNLYPITLTAVIAPPGFSMALWVAVSTNVDISDDESTMVKDNLFKPQVKVTKQMTQNLTFCTPRISKSEKLASKWHVYSSYFMFPFYFTPENLTWGNLYIESSSVALCW